MNQPSGYRALIITYTGDKAVTGMEIGKFSGKRKTGTFFQVFKTLKISLIKKFVRLDNRKEIARLLKLMDQARATRVTECKENPF